MGAQGWAQIVLYSAILMALAYPLGIWMARVYTRDKSDPVERLFVIVAVLGVISFEIWFFFFAGDPLPSQPAF